jgi:hypothetical protein
MAAWLVVDWWPQNGVGSAPETRDAGEIRVRAWRDQVTGYALLSNGMDLARIDRLAEPVVRLTDPGQIVDDGHPCCFAGCNPGSRGLRLLKVDVAGKKSAVSAFSLFTGTSTRERGTNNE